MKKMVILFICFAFLATGCSLFKSDAEKYSELTNQFKQSFQQAQTREEKEKLADDYKKAVPEKFKMQASSTITNEFFLDSARNLENVKFRGGNSKIANYGDYNH